MGIFQGKNKPGKKAPIDETSDGVQRFFDGYFSELKERGRAYFQDAASKNAEDFKKDLDISVAKVSTELHNYVVQRIEEQIADNAKAMKDAQQAALQAFDESIVSMKQQHQQLLTGLQKSASDMQQNVVSQDAVLSKEFEENRARIVAMKDAQEAALKQLEQSVQQLQQESQLLGQQLQKNASAKEQILIDAFEENMARIIEHYLLGALGDEFDLKSQLPSIIKQMEANKQAIVDDMKL